jgi:hypothetical protein
MRKTVVAASIALSAMALVNGVARADDVGEPIAGCPVASNLSSTGSAIEQVDRSIYTDQEWNEVWVPLLQSVDANSDGYVCWKQFKPNRGQDKQWGAEDYVVTAFNDNIPSGRLGKSIIVP